MKISNEEIWTVKPVFQKLTSQQVVLDSKIFYRLIKISRKLKAAYKEVDDRRVKLIEKYADPQTEEDIKRGAKTVKVNLEAFNKEFQDILKEVIDLDIERIPMVEFAGKDFKLSADEFEVLEKFIGE